MPKGYYEPAESSVPALLLTGQFDHMTQPEYAEKVAWHLANSRHIVLTGLGHDDLDPCALRWITTFIHTGSAANLDTQCLEKRFRFAIRAADLTASDSP